MYKNFLSEMSGKKIDMNPEEAIANIKKCPVCKKTVTKKRAGVLRTYCSKQCSIASQKGRKVDI
jgi:hypothetical protein